MPRGPGRPKFEPSDEQRRTVKAMAGYGIKQDEISAALEIDKKTLRKHFRLELDTGTTVANAKVAESLYQNAISGNVAAQIFWLKARADWSEKTRLAGADGGPIETYELSEAERNHRLAAIIDAARARGAGQASNGRAADMDSSDWSAD